MHQQPKLILVINHQRHMRDLLKSDLLYLGHSNVIEAASGGGGMKMIVEYSPDLVIIGLNIPDLLGITLFLNWVNQWRKPPELQPVKAIAIKSNGAETTKAAARAAGCRVVLSDQYRLECLRRAVETTLA